MESLGKGYSIDQKRPLSEDEKVGLFVLGDTGTDCQHSFM
jgi:hypothetical protein